MIEAPGASEIDYVFHPRSVAVVGASPPQPGFGGGGAGFILALKEMEFPAIYPVNPKYQELEGLRCYPSLLDIEGPVDHVISSVPAAIVPQLVEDCIAKGVRCIHFFTAGFSETGEEERAELEAEVVARATGAGIRIIGPNCMGLYVPKARLAILTGTPKDPGPVAFISQSGGNANALVYAAAPRGIRFSKVVSYGNAADINEGDLLEYLAEDPETGIICAYIEGVKDGRRFLEAMRKAASVKPLIVLKGGRTQAGTRAVRSHTGSLAGSAQVFDALCRQAGAVQVKSLEEMIDLTVAFRYMGVPRGPRLAVMGMGGGLSVFAADEIDEAGLSCPTLPDYVQARLRELVPVAGTSIRNPVDAAVLPDQANLPETLAALLSADNIDLLLCHASFSWGASRPAPPTTSADDLVAELAKAREADGKPIAVAVGREPFDAEGMDRTMAFQEKCWRAGLPAFPDIPRACNAIAKVLAWHEQREEMTAD